MDDSLGAILIICILVCFSAFFSATETAFTSLNRIRLKHLASEGDEKAEKVLALSENYDKLLTTILVGNNIVNIAMTAVATALFISLYGKYGTTVATAVITVVVLVFGEISPKTLAKENPESFSKFAYGMVKLLMFLLTPINYIFSKWQILVTKLFGGKGENNITHEEIKTFVEEAHVGGSLEAEQNELIQNAIEFNELKAEDVLTPRVDIIAVDHESTEAEVGEVFRETGFSRLPVYDDDLDKILGVINQKDFHNYVVGTDDTIADFVKPVVFVASSMKVSLLLKMMQREKTHIAIIVDEYGGTEGLVTLEDIIEELVGDIYDEHDAIMSQEISELKNGSYRVMGNANLAKIFDFLEIDEEIDVNTINGWVVLELDKLPKKGDEFEVVYGDLKIKVRVTKANSKKALEINLKKEMVKEESQWD